MLPPSALSAEETLLLLALQPSESQLSDWQQYKQIQRNPEDLKTQSVFEPSAEISKKLLCTFYYLTACGEGLFRSDELNHWGDEQSVYMSDEK